MGIENLLKKFVNALQLMSFIYFSKYLSTSKKRDHKVNDNGHQQKNSFIYVWKKKERKKFLPVEFNHLPLFLTFLLFLFGHRTGNVVCLFAHYILRKRNYSLFYLTTYFYKEKILFEIFKEEMHKRNPEFDCVF